MVRSRRSIGQSAAQPTSSYPGASTTTSTRNNSLAGRNARPIQDTTPSVRTPRDPCIRTSKRAERPSAQPRNLPTDLADSMSQETSNQHPDSSDPTTEWFQVKDIIAERRSARNPRKKEYRVDWCPNKETGEEYPPTWEPEEYINITALADWQRRQSQRKQEPGRSAHKKNRHQSRRPDDKSEPAVSAPTDNSSQPVLPANQRKRPRRRPSPTPESDLSGDDPISKRPRLESDNTHSTPSIAVGRSHSFEVCIPQKLGYDTSEYLSVLNSQNTNSQSISAQEDEDELIHVPIDSQRTIPDSQELDSVPQQSIEFPDSQTNSSLDTGSGPIAVEGRAEPRREQSLATESPIPSRQPDQESFSRVPSLTPDDSVNFDPAQESESEAPHTIEETPSQPVFLTQDPDSNYYRLSHSAGPQTVTDSELITSEPAVEVSQTLSGPSQAAQVVTPIFTLPPHSQLDQSSSSSSSNIVPDTVLRGSRFLTEERHQTLSRYPHVHPWEPSSPSSNSSRFSFAATRLVRNTESPAPSRSSSVVRTPSRMSSSGTPKRSTREILMEAALSGFKPLVPEPNEAQLPEPQPDASGDTSGAQAGGAPESAPVLEPEPSPPTNLPTSTTTLHAETLQPAIQMAPSIHINSEPQPDITLQITSVDPIAISNPEPQHPQPLIPIPDSMTGPFLGPDITESLPRTVSPSEISRSVEPELPPLQMDEPLDLGLDNTGPEEALPIPTPGTASPLIEGEDSSTAGTNEYLVTLQMPANVMQLYVDTYNSYKHEIEVFSEARRESQEIDPALIAKIDVLLDQLYRLCDYPGENSPQTIRQLSSQDLAKHALSSNVKLFFVGQLMEKLATSNKNVLVVARSSELVGYLEAIITSIGDVAYSKTDLDDIKDRGSEPELAVVLTRAEQHVKDLGNFDVVVALDSSFASSELTNRLEAIPSNTKPMVITLVNTYTIEHLDLAIPPGMDNLTRKNAMLISLYHSRPYLSHFEDDISADRIAAHFAGHIMEQEQEQDAFFDWKPQEVPHILLDFYGTAQRTQPKESPQAQPDADDSDSRKRKLDDTEDVSSKRPRHSMPQGELDETVRSQVVPDPSQVHLTVTKAHLDALQATVDQLGEKLKESEELEIIRGRQISQMSKQIKSYESTANSIQQRLMEAQHERASAEKARMAADESAKATDAILKSVEDKYSMMEHKYRQAVEERSSEDATFAQLTAKDKELEDAQAKIKELERRLKNKDGDLDYARSVFQNERQEAQQTISENRDLREQLQKLKTERAQDLIKVQSINAANGHTEMQRLVHEAQSIARDREAELDRVKEELKALKNGRRETRGASVPRSPRMGVMSPRNGRGGMSTVASTAASTGVSRGTSPAHLAAPFDQAGMPPAVPGSQFFNPPSANARFNHLRDFL